MVTFTADKAEGQERALPGFAQHLDILMMTPLILCLQLPAPLTTHYVLYTLMLPLSQATKD